MNHGKLFRKQHRRLITVIQAIDFVEFGNKLYEYLFTAILIWNR